MMSLSVNVNMDSYLKHRCNSIKEEKLAPKNVDDQKQMENVKKWKKSDLSESNIVIFSPQLL